MTELNALSLFTTIREDKFDDLIILLNKIIADGIETNSIMPFGKISTIHLARWVVLEKAKDLKGVEIPPRLVFESNYEGPEDAHIDEMLDVALPGLTHIFSHCEEFPRAAQVPRDEVKLFIKDHIIENKGFYIGAWGRSVAQIRGERELYATMQQYLDDNRQALLHKKPTEIRNSIREFVWSKPEFAWAKKPPEPRTAAQKWSYYGEFAFHMAVLIIFLPFWLIMAVIFMVMLRNQEKKEPVTSDKIDPNKIGLLVSKETYRTQSQFSAVGNLRPGTFRLRFCKVMLWLINWAAKYLFNKGALGTIPTIHFARWMITDNDRRMVFFSNVDGDSQTYLTDFINKQPGPMAAVFCHTDEFPKTRWLMLDGARDYKRFLVWARKKQVPSQVFYSAYEDLTIKRINHHTAVRKGLYGDMTEEAAQKWLYKF